MSRNFLKIPTSGRLAGWLFTKRGEVESGTTKHKYLQWQGPPDYKCGALTTMATLPPQLILKGNGIKMEFIRSWRSALFQIVKPYVWKLLIALDKNYDRLAKNRSNCDEQKL